jgi:ketosteroid isomerase-like protein
MKQAISALGLALFLTAGGAAQNSNSSATRQRTTATGSTKKTSTTAATAPASKQNSTAPGGKTAAGSNGATTAKDPTSHGVMAAFNALIEGIRHANVGEVTAAYWNSPRLLTFNMNGTVTKGWEQLRQNREASYPNLKDVKLDYRDLRIEMIGREAAVVTCLWTQSQTVKGVSESASGRMTLVFRRVGDSWKVMHLHTSPDRPDASKVLPTDSDGAPAGKP